MLRGLLIFGVRSIVLLTIISITYFACSTSSPPPATSKINLPASEGIYNQWDSLGIKKGQHVPDFIIYSQDGVPFHLYEQLKKGKPIVLINGSYTCDVSRANLPVIKSLTEHYNDKLSFYMVYTIEAHPSDTTSPYSSQDTIWIAKNNLRDSVEAEQPRTYAERVELSKHWKHEYDIESTVLVDDPGNTYWTNFGQAPNMAYIIDTDGTVYYKQAWFRKEQLEEQIQARVE